jgi:hypothetical protein
VRNLRNRAIEVRYEELLSEPNRLLRHIVDFCELQAKEGDIERVAKQVKVERAYAYRSDPELEGFSARVAERLRRHGY